MSDRALIRLARAAAVTGGVLALIGASVSVAITGAGSWLSEGDAFQALFSVFFAVFVWLVIPKQPENPVVWTMAAAAFLGGIFTVGSAAAALVVEDPGLVLDDSVIPADLPQLSAWILMFTRPTGMLAVFFLVLGVILFPDGKWLSPLWVWVAALAGGGLFVAAVAYGWSYRPESTAVAGEGPIITAGILVSLPGLVLSMVPLVSRFRRSTGAERQQFKLITWGTWGLPAALLASALLRNTRYEALTEGPILIGTLMFLGAYGIAVGKYRIFDIDVVIRRTVLYTIVVGLLAALYTGTVMTLRTLLPGENQLAVAASTLAVAALFNPLRRRIQRGLDKHFYRSSYDAQLIAESFADRLRNETDIKQMTTDMLQTVDYAVKPAAMGIWIREPDQD